MADSMPEVKQCDLNTATSLLAHAVGAHCCSRAGAVCNATRDEYRQLSSEKVDGVVSRVFCVAKHKTSSSSGSAAIVINDFKYVTIIRRRQLDSESKNEPLFILCGEKQLTKLSDRIKMSGQKLHTLLATHFRLKICTTLVQSDQVAAETILHLHKQPAAIQEAGPSTPRKVKPNLSHSIRGWTINIQAKTETTKEEVYASAKFENCVILCRPHQAGEHTKCWRIYQKVPYAWKRTAVDSRQGEELH